MPALVVIGIIILIFHIGQSTGLLQFALTISISGILAAGIFRFAFIVHSIPSLLLPKVAGHDVRLEIDGEALKALEKQANLGTIGVSFGVAVLLSLLLAPPDLTGYRDPLLGQVSIVFKLGGPVFAALAASLWQYALSVEKLAKARRSALAGEFGAHADQLGTIERQVAATAARIAAVAPSTRLPELTGAFRELGRQVVSGAGRSRFRERIDAILAASREDLRAIGSIANEIERIQFLHKDVTDAVAASGLYSLFAHVNDIWSFVNSRHLSDLVALRNYEEVFSQIAAVRIELEALLERARSLRPETPPSAPSPSPSPADIWDEDIQLSRSDPDSIPIALARLASKRGDPPQRVRRVYLALVKAYNAVQNEDGDDRRFQQLNEAYHFLKREGLAA